MRMMTQDDIAKATGVSQPHISEVFRDIKPVGKKTAIKFAAVSPGHTWTDFLTMSGVEIEKVLRSVLCDRRSGDDRRKSHGRREDDTCSCRAA